MAATVRFLQKIPPIAWIILVWAMAVLPNLTVRSFIWDEGIIAVIARDIVGHGKFLEPSVFGVRWCEEPALLPWFIAATARYTGGVHEWSARLPSMLGVLVTSLFVFGLARRHASEVAAFFAAGCFLFCPLLLQKLTIAEPDTVITAFSFAALFCFRGRGQPGRVDLLRWIVCGLLLSLCALAKGPQPVAFFALGVGGYILAGRRWNDLPGLVFCLLMPAGAVLIWGWMVYRPGDFSVWLGYMRIGNHLSRMDYILERFNFTGSLLLELIPATFLVPFLFYRSGQVRTAGQNELIRLLCWYAGAATLVLFFWTGARTRYAMPAAPAVAVLAGIAFDQIRHRSLLLGRVAVSILAGLFLYQMALVWVIMPVYADRFGSTRTDGRIIDRILQPFSALPVFNVGGQDADELFYVNHPIRRIELCDAALIKPPAILLIEPVVQAGLEKQRPDLNFQPLVRLTNGHHLIVVRVDSGGN
ncbi:MAG: glycosyltransferase family 39 protein [Verrucomicrobiota bacterium]